MRRETGQRKPSAANGIKIIEESPGADRHWWPLHCDHLFLSSAIVQNISATELVQSLYTELKVFGLFRLWGIEA